jgi:DNA repair protein RecO (recombination protein O)
LEPVTIQAVVIGSVTYSDSSKVVKVLTKESGVIPIWVRTGKKSNKAIWHPLSMVELSGFTRKKTGGLANFKEASRYLPANNLLNDAKRSSVAFFIAEVLDKSLEDEVPLPEVFNLMIDIINLIELETTVSNLHIFFMSRLVEALGLMPEEYDKTNMGAVKSLNLDTGEWSEINISLTAKDHYLNIKLASLLMAISGMNFGQLQGIWLPKSDKKELLLGMVMFVQLHHSGLREIKSYDVLETIFAT